MQNFLNNYNHQNIVVDWPLFKRVVKNGSLNIHDLKQKIIDSGLELNDPRIKETIEKINLLPETELLNAMTMETLISESVYLLHRALTQELVVPQWKDFAKEIQSIMDSVRHISSGTKATYIPALAEVDENLFGVSVCTIDGQRLDLGDTDYKFSIQSCSKPSTYLASVLLKGTDFVHRYVGKEPSGTAFNSLTLKVEYEPDGSKKYIPHNSLINSGSIMCSSIIKQAIKNNYNAFNFVANLISRLSGCPDEKPTFSEYVFESELLNADRNRCLAYMMREYKSFPDPNESVKDVLKLYFKFCSIKTNTRRMAVLAASLANGGVCPITNEAIHSTADVRNCLSQMLSCGMYDYSGEWAFRVGLPAKSGVSGCIFIVIPNKMGIAIYSPKLDELGNSVRGIAFAQRLVQRLNVHQLDNFHSKSGKIEPCLPATKMATSIKKQHLQNISRLLFTAARGDLSEIQRLISNGLDPFVVGVDDRTALHLAACENRLGVVDFLLRYARAQDVPLERVLRRDSFGNTAIDDAIRERHPEAARMIEEYLAEETAEGAKKA